MDCRRLGPPHRGRNRPAENATAETPILATRLRAAADSRWSLLQQALQRQPFGEPVDPPIRRKVLLSHPEAVAAFRVHVQFGRFVSARQEVISSESSAPLQPCATEPH